MDLIIITFGTWYFIFCP